MAKWIPWEEIREELMQDISFKEECEQEFEEFRRQNAADLAAERAAAVPVNVVHYPSKPATYAGGVPA